MIRKKWWLMVIGIIILSLIVWVIILSSRQVQRSERIQQEISLLEKEAEKIRHENETLSQKIQYFASDDFREQEAKRKLGLKKENENVVIINSRSNTLSAGDESEIRKEKIDDTKANYKKWFELFF